MKNEKIRFWGLFFVLTFCFAILNAQTTVQIELMERHFEPNVHKHYDVKLAKNNRNELQFVFGSLFFVYKEFIASQDSYSCVFTPTCSEFAIMVIRKKGAFMGLLSSFDRLSRCNGLSPELYKIDQQNSKLIDPVSDY